MKIWKEISEQQLAANFASLQRILSEGQGLAAEASSLLAVVKANAYGHGIEPCAAVLVAAGAEWLGVTDAQEGARVRAALWNTVEPAFQSRDMEPPDRWRVTRPEILVMSGTVCLAGEAECIVRNRLTAVVWEENHVAQMAEAARSFGEGEPVRVHVEVDSGMSRQGAQPGAALEKVLRAIAKERLVTLGGVFTHFASTEVADSAQTAAQQRSFETAIDGVAAAGLRPQWVHVGNSSYIDSAAVGLDNGGRKALTWLHLVAAKVGARSMVRSGLALYGYLLPIEGAGESLASARVRPVLTWKTRVIAVRDLQAGAAVGYNGTFIAKRAMRLAVLPVGYADGLRRELSSDNSKTGNAEAGGWVMVREQRAPIVGRISMNLTTVDVSWIEGVAAGDEAVLLGDGVSADDHARIARTIPYDILCGVRTSSLFDDAL